MSENHEGVEFVTFPRRDLAFRLSRRDLFGWFRAEVQVNQEQAEGIPGCRLADLGNAPDEYLAQVVPIIVPGCSITVDKGQVWGQLPTEKKPVPLFATELATTHTFNLFNGYNDLGTIARLLADEMNWSEEQAFSLARGLFLHLVQARMFAPR